MRIASIANNKIQTQPQSSYLNFKARPTLSHQDLADGRAAARAIFTIYAVGRRNLPEIFPEYVGKLLRILTSMDNRKINAAILAAIEQKGWQKTLDEIEPEVCEVARRVRAGRPRRNV